MICFLFFDLLVSMLHEIPVSPKFYPGNDFDDYDNARAT